MAAKKTVPKELITEEMREAGVDETTPMVTKEQAQKEMSPEAIAYMEMILNYKKHNPVKYAQKEEAFLKKLNTL